MNKISKALLVLGSTAILTGCGVKASFAKFKAAVGKIKAHEYTKCVAKVDKEEYAGTWKTVELPVVGKVSMWEPDTLDNNEIRNKSFIVANMFLTAADANDLVEHKAEDGEKVTYFVNNLGYEYIDKDGNKERVEWNKYGLVKSYVYDAKDDKEDFSAKFSYSK